MSHAIYRFGPFTVNTGTHTLLKGETRLSIQEQPLQVLLALLESSGQVVTREALRVRLWGTDTFVDFDQSLNSAVRRLRLALEDNSRDPVFVETIPRIGFRFLPEVTVERGGGVAATATRPLGLGAPQAAGAAGVTGTAGAVQPAYSQPRQESVQTHDRGQAQNRGQTQDRGPGGRRYFPALAGGVVVLLLGLVAGSAAAYLGGRGTFAQHAGMAPDAAVIAEDKVAGGDTTRYVPTSETGANAALHAVRGGKLGLQGWYHLRRRTEVDYQSAEQDFEEALRQQPTDASARVGLGETEVLMALNGNRAGERLRRAREEAQKALALSPRLAAAHAVLGAADALADWNDVAAEQEFRTALQLSPEDSLAHLWFAVFVLLPRREYHNAESEAAVAVQQDPLSLIAHTDLGWILYSEGKREAALEEYRFVLRLDPEFVPAVFRMHQLRQAEEYGEGGAALPETRPGTARVVEAAAHRPERPQETSPACAQADNLLEMPGSGQLPVLRAAVQQRCPTAYFFGQDPELARLQNDPGFVQLLQTAHPPRHVHP